MRKLMLGLGALLLFSGAIRAQNTVQMQCRQLADDGSDVLAPNETFVAGMACHKVASAPALPPAQPAATPDPAPVAKAADPDPTPGNIQRDPHLVWIDLTDPYASYVEAAAQKKHVPVEFTTQKERAGLLIALSADHHNGSAWQTIFTGDSGEASMLSMTVSDAATGTMVFSYTCHKGGKSFLATGHEDFQSAAECLAKHWAEHSK